MANELGGYASATIAGAITRRYHGFLIAALPRPLGRMVVLNDTEVDLEREDGSVVNIREGGRFLGFALDMGLPSWRYEIDGVVIEKSIVVPSRQNIVHLTFRRIGNGKPVHLRFRPFINFRQLEAPLGGGCDRVRPSGCAHWSRLSRRPNEQTPNRNHEPCRDCCTADDRRRPGPELG